MFQISKNSFIKVVKDVVELSDKEYKELADDMPKTRETIKLFGKEHLTPRFQKLYGSSDYSYSGINLVSQKDNIPALVTKCIEYTRKCEPKFQWQGALVNWYSELDHYIGVHSDNEEGLTKGAPIYSFSFGLERDFVVKSKKTFVDAYVSKLVFPTKHNSLIVMGGKMQSEFTHEIIKLTEAQKKKVTGSPLRINITVRSFS